jgi:hypothetical protein
MRSASADLSNAGSISYHDIIVRNAVNRGNILRRTGCSGENNLNVIGPHLGISHPEIHDHIIWPTYQERLTISCSRGPALSEVTNSPPTPPQKRRAIGLGLDQIH